jgi:hypothetical protein
VKNEEGAHDSRAGGEKLKVSDDIWWTGAGSNRRLLPCHGSQVAADHRFLKDLPSVESTKTGLNGAIRYQIATKIINRRKWSLTSNYGKPGAGWSANRLAARALSSFEDVHVGHDQDLLQRQFRVIDTPHEAPSPRRRIHETAK